MCQYEDTNTSRFKVVALVEGFNVRETVEFVRQAERAGLDFITVHGRLKSQRSSTPPNLDAIALVKSTVQCPVVANGDVYSIEDAKRIVATTKVDGPHSLKRG